MPALMGHYEKDGKSHAKWDCAEADIEKFCP